MGHEQLSVLALCPCVTLFSSVKQRLLFPQSNYPKQVFGTGSLQEEHACAHTWKTKVLEAKAFSAHLRSFLAQIKPLAFGGKKTNRIILKSEIKWGL
jgi:hypothetical protein